MSKEKSVDKETLMEDLNDKRCVGLEMNQDMWHLSRKETAEYLLDKYNITSKPEIEPDNEKPYLYFEGEKYYFGEEYEFSDERKKEWETGLKFMAFHINSKWPFCTIQGDFAFIRKIDHATKYKNASVPNEGVTPRQLRPATPSSCIPVS